MDPMVDTIEGARTNGAGAKGIIYVTGQLLPSCPGGSTWCQFVGVALRS